MARSVNRLGQPNTSPLFRQDKKKKILSLSLALLEGGGGGGGVGGGRMEGLVRWRRGGGGYINSHLKAASAIH